MIFRVRDLKRIMARKLEKHRGPGIRLSPLGKRYDWRPDLPDFRDVRYKLRAPVPLPPKMDLRPKMSPVYDQGTIGSCTANALAACIEYLQLQQLCQPGQGSVEFDPTTFCQASRLFIYWNERELMGTPTEDSGGYLRDGVKSLNTVGVCRELYWPYDAAYLYRKPAQLAYQEAQRFKVTSYERCGDLQQIKSALAEGFPVAFGFMVYESFEGAQIAVSGKMSMPTDNERDLGGHAVCTVGYDDAERVLITRNSWGPDWGDKGYFYMPYEYIERPGLSDDFWAVRG